MKKVSMVIKVFVITVCLFLLTLTSVFAKTDNTTSKYDPDLDTNWQGIVDGDAGHGSIFYRLRFHSDGTVTVHRQNAGHNCKEEKTWKKTGDKLEISSKPGDEITDFDGADLKFTGDETFSYDKNSYETDFKEHKTGWSVFNWIMILVVLLIINEIFRRLKWTTMAVYIILPFALIPLWYDNDVSYWFKWVNMYSIVAVCIWVLLMRFTKLGQFKYSKLLVPVLFAINIGEAVVQDFSMEYCANILNAIAGIFCLITLFYGWKEIKTDDTREKNLIWPKMSILWIIVYDIWSWVFVYLNFPGSASAQFMVLLACTLPAIFIEKGTWLQARAFTLVAWFLYYFSFPHFTESLELKVPRNGYLMVTVAIISIVLNVLYALKFAKDLYIEKKIAGN